MTHDFSGTRVVILGLARQGVALARYLASHGAHVVVSDLRAEHLLKPAMDQLEDLSIDYVLGNHPLGLLESIDVLYLSGGVPVEAPIVREACARGIQLSNDSQLFLDACPALVLGITGSAGKSTTTALVAEMCQASGRTTWVGGNIGWSMLSDLEQIEPDDLVVVELSSFQLEVMTLASPIGAILNLTPNHLDRHKTMERYTAAKARLLDFQPAGGVTVLGRDDDGAWALQPRVRGRLRSFSAEREIADGAFLKDGIIKIRDQESERAICPAEDIHLIGHHNVLNVLAASVLADSAGVPQDAIVYAIRTFKGVPHRLELVRELDGVKWFDDSISTAPERLIAALKSFDAPIILLAGGRDKDLPWEEAAELMRQRAKMIVLFGEAAGLVESSLERASGPLPEIVLSSGLEEAVVIAASWARDGDIVLLSPGGTSFDAYRDFEQRGEHFKSLVLAL